MYATYSQTKPKFERFDTDQDLEQTSDFLSHFSLSLSLSAIITFLLFVLQDRLRSDNMQQTADKAVLTIVDTCNIYRTGHNDKKTKLLRLLSFTKI